MWEILDPPLMVSFNLFAKVHIDRMPQLINFFKLFVLSTKSFVLQAAGRALISD